jgi:hypothetical protein
MRILQGGIRARDADKFKPSKGLESSTRPRHLEAGRSMIRKSGHRLSEKIVLNQNARAPIVSI